MSNKNIVVSQDIYLLIRHIHFAYDTRADQNSHKFMKLLFLKFVI